MITQTTSAGTPNHNFVWDVPTLKWVVMTQPSGGGGGGGAATIADGADVAEGATTDAAVQGDNPGTISAKLRGLNKSVADGVPITAAALPLPANAAKETGGNLATIVSDLTNRTQFTKITDGTRDSTVKASNVTTVSGDTALVVDIRQFNASIAALAVGDATNNDHVLIQSIDTVTHGRSWASQGASFLIGAYPNPAYTGVTLSFFINAGAGLIGSIPLKMLNLKTGVWESTSVLVDNSMDNLWWVGGLSTVSVSVLGVVGTGTVGLYGVNHSSSYPPTVLQGQQTMALSAPVAIASDQSAVPVSGTVALSGTVSTKTDLTPSAPTVASVGVASAQAVAANANRKGLVLTNVSTARISLGLGSAAVLDSGITLYPGGVFEMDEFLFDLGAVNAIASAAASNLGIQELTT